MYKNKSIDVYYEIFRIKIKSHYSFEDRGTDRQNRFRNVLSKTFQIMYDTLMHPRMTGMHKQRVDDTRTISWIAEKFIFISTNRCKKRQAQ